MAITYAREDNLAAEEFADMLAETSMATKRPIKNPGRMQRLMEGANFIVTARDETGLLIGAARCISDGAWICYCAELAVRESHQGQGIGKQILVTAKDLLGPDIGLTLNAEPDAVAFYEKIGMAPYKAFFFKRSNYD